MKAIILVGGFGTRLRPLTNHIPKNIVPFCGVPFLAYQFELLKKVGIKDITFSLGYKPDQIRKVFGDGRKYGVKLHYVVEKSPLGTAGAIKNAERFVKGGPAVILNGDILTDLDLGQMISFHKSRKSIATLGLVEVKDPTAYGLVLTGPGNHITRFVEKPTQEEAVANTINGGVYIFEPEVFDYIPQGVPHSAERALFPHLLRMKAGFFGFVWKGYWQDIGTPEKYLTSQWDVLKGDFPVLVKAVKGSDGVWKGKGVKVAPGAKVAGPSILMDGCVLEEGADLQAYSVLGPKCRMGKNSVVSRSVLWDGVHVGEGVRLEEILAGRNCRIGDRSRIMPGSVLADDTKA
jgi:NDP-sugar pyrophosphorylase family protein